MHLFTYFVQVLLEFFCHLEPAPFLHVQHDPQGLPGLVGSELVDEMVHVDEEQVAVVNLLLALRGLGGLDQQVQQVQEVDQQGVVQLVKLAFAVDVFGGVESLDAL